MRLQVQDAGPGILDGALLRIFDPLFSTRDRAGGKGLGLSIVHGIVAEHGGSIEVEKRNDRGTRFRVILPVNASAAALH